ncbi:MAG: 30S ribosomal protein S16 [Candidatus Yonathbacteria bacterium RIFCSPHIGHO2_01_FULL_51_10]|uniref:30S ribosomal protein S16 n=1 Tax=Candidatus Yonathbacteria bacterium RIFCSPHIGHO2_01_FULL_51_10 TaxID=1802723 RepID=A0A1G2SAF6_9BACT|nr:MAG: 30S ribosomal protein S16 [Candidatus Yonathbacteria bacterium RIFCSPHIGHO2_01_FULL_51_10]
MLKIRLQRIGRKNDPSFRMIVTDSRRAAKKSNFVEVVGSYDARKGTPAINAERVKHWMSVGAQASGTVHNILVSSKVVGEKKRNVLPKKTVPAKAAEAVAEVAPEPTPIVPAEEAPAPEAAVEAA